MGIQVEIAASQVDKGRIGYASVSLTHFTDTAEPSIAAGSKVEIGGALYEFTGDETGTGWAGLSASAIAYILLTPSGATVSWSYTNTAPTWDTAKQGWYTGSNRVVAMLYKDAASLYQFKNIIPPGQSTLTFLAVIQSTVNPFLFNLPAATGTGMRVRVVDSSVLSTGLVRVAPNGTDQIGSAGNASCYLQNVDQSGYVYKHQFLDLVDSHSGYWAVVGGQLCPDQATDTDGSQYHLGKLHHLPLGNTASRELLAFSAPPALSSWSSAILATGLVGVPSVAKAVRMKATFNASATAAGACQLQIGFSDNNSNAPTVVTPHPLVSTYFTAAGAASVCGMTVVLDVPVNSSGQFYMYTLLATNMTIASCRVQIGAVGYYMGD